METRLNLWIKLLDEVEFINELDVDYVGLVLLRAYVK